LHSFQPFYLLNIDYCNAMKDFSKRSFRLFFAIGFLHLYYQNANSMTVNSVISPPKEAKINVSIAERKRLDSLRRLEVKHINDWYRWDITTNSTMALSRFAGNTSRSLDNDPYMMMIRKFDKNYNDSGYLVGSVSDTQGLEPPTRRHNWRIGYNGFVGKSVDALSGASRETQDIKHSVVIGREWRKHLDEDFYIFGGVELRAFYNLNEATTTSVNTFGGLDVTISHRSEVGGGADLFGGLGYRINKRLSIYTECNLMFQASRVYRYFDYNTNRTTLESSDKFGFRPLVPVALFVSYSF